MIFDERDVLLKAASIVEEGWCQHFYWKGADIVNSNVHCAVGALGAASVQLGLTTLDDPWTGEAMFRAENALANHIGSSVVYWNDSPGRTADEVAEAMRKAANGNLG